MKKNHKLILTVACLTSFSCENDELSALSSPAGTISTDQQLFALVTQEQPFGSYRLFPNADSVATGTLNGSTAHRPMVRVSLNETAAGALRAGHLPEGSSFPDGSVVFKEVRQEGQPILFAIVYKDRSNPLSNEGWLWAELRTDGTAAFSMQNRGNGCVSCHAREQGPQHDYIRTFERQR